MGLTLLFGLGGTGFSVALLFVPAGSALWATFGICSVVGLFVALIGAWSLVVMSARSRNS